VILGSNRIVSGWIVAPLMMALLAVTPISALAKKQHPGSKHSSSKHSSSKHSSSRLSSPRLSASASKSKHGKRGRHSISQNWRHRGQQKVDAQRTQQIQDALARANYLSGEPSGVWDAKTEDALRRYQASNGWQAKVVPDSRALIKLGLGPSDKKLINPDSAMTSRPESAKASTSGPNISSPNSGDPQQ
jgi:hypothetical protein